MGLFFKKKTEVAKNANDEEMLKTFGPRIQAMIVLAQTEEAKKELANLKNKIEYMNVSPKPEIQKIDKKIDNALGDLKVSVIKNIDLEQLKQEINLILAQVAEREAYYF